MRDRLLTFAVPIFILFYATAAFADAAADAMLRDAAMKLDFAMVKTALAKGANPNAPSDTKSRTTPLGYLMWGLLMHRGEGNQRKAVQVAETLFAGGAKLGPFDRGILFFPISKGNEELVALLLDKGASPTRRIEGYTPTELAIQYGRTRVYDLLVSRGGIPVNASKSAQLALVEAGGSGDLDGIKVAIAAGGRVNGRDPTGRTALINAVRTPLYERTRAEAIWWLLDNGADPNITGDSGFKGLDGIPLHIFVAMNKRTLEGAARRSSEVRVLAEETLIRLIRAGAKVSGMDSSRKTPLHIAAEFDNIRAAEVLIQEGARVMARDKEGRTPLDYAESAGMIRLLKANGATER